MQPGKEHCPSRQRGHGQATRLSEPQFPHLKGASRLCFLVRWKEGPVHVNVLPEDKARALAPAQLAPPDPSPPGFLPTGTAGHCPGGSAFLMSSSALTSPWSSRWHCARATSLLQAGASHCLLEAQSAHL